MSRFNPDWDIEPILEAATYWRDHALIDGKSIFTDARLWSDQNIEGMNQHYAENLDEGDGNFLTKFEHQLADAPQETKQLAAEMMWFMLLCPSNVRQPNKRETVLTIWDWSNAPRPSIEPFLQDNVLRGIGSAGTAFNTHRWREVVFFVRFLQKFRAEEPSHQRQLVKDPWGMAEWMRVVPEADSRQLRHMILYLLFPDSFERIFGRSDRLKLIHGFTDLSKAQIAKMSALEVNETIQKIRRDQETRYPGQKLDFYIPPLIEGWSDERKRESQPESADPFDEITRQVTRTHVLAAIKEIDEQGIPTNAVSSTYDLILDDRRYPPKYVLSLACKYATGEEFPRQFFQGGVDSKAFRVLENLGFHIEIKTFLPELITKFIEQADERVNLAVSEYPKEYRGLSVNVSFGQGNFARIPWVSFTGYEQTTSNGIYPVLLYLKSHGRLIAAYGISETNEPKRQWKDLGDAITIKAYLTDVLGEAPERYGKSYVLEAFDLAEGLDAPAVGKAIDQLIGRYHEQFAGTQEHVESEDRVETYGLEEALDGLFVEEEKLEEFLRLLKLKKNVILQGPPGVGKTFVSKRLAYALMGEKRPEKLGMVQFHQSYAYEDFIQGYRPSGTGFKLKNGVFFEFCDKAKKDPAGTYVFIIDEINRGNLSKVFGELMLLIEADKRGPDWAIPLTYSEDTESKFYIPENLYLIGLMNTADRSLAMVDYALRRRFAFADLVPGFDTDEFRQFMIDKGAAAEFVSELILRLEEVNAKISADTTNLGRGYCIGHSFFCVVPEGSQPDWPWFRQIISAEIAPLLREYYFDDDKQAVALIDALLRQP